MGSEKSLWQTMRRNVNWAFGEYVHLQRHEDTAALGIPDVSYSIRPDMRKFKYFNGWIELKYSAEYPKRETSVVPLKHFTIEQREWLIARGTLGAHCCILWQIGTDYYVFNWQQAALLGTMTNEELVDCVYWVSYGKPNWRDLMIAITET